MHTWHYLGLVCVCIKFICKESTFCYCSKALSSIFCGILEATHISCKMFPHFCVCLSGSQDANTREFNSLDIRHLNPSIWDDHPWLNSLGHDSCKLFLPFPLGWVVLWPGSACFSPLATKKAGVNISGDVDLCTWINPSLQFQTFCSFLLLPVYQVTPWTNAWACQEICLSFHLLLGWGWTSHPFRMSPAPLIPREVQQRH